MQAAANYFDFFGLPHKLNLDSKELESRFYALSKQWHPDLFARGTPEERRTSEDATAILNDGYRTLKEPVSRAEYLLKERGFEIGGQKSSVPPELLDEVFDLNSALEDEIENSREQLEEFGKKFLAMREELDRELLTQFTAFDEFETEVSLEAIRGILNKRKYISNLVVKVEKALA